MRKLRQVATVCSWNFRSIGTRAQSALIVVLGFFGVVLVFVAVLAMRDGIVGQMTTKGADGVAVLYRSVSGSITSDMLPMIEQVPGTAQSTRGPLVSGTLYGASQVAARIARRSGNEGRRRKIRLGDAELPDSARPHVSHRPQ